MFDEFKTLLENMSIKEKNAWIDNLKSFTSEKAILEAQKAITFDLKTNILTLYKRNYRVDSFLKLLGKLQQINLEIYDDKGKKLDNSLLGLPKTDKK